MKRYHNSEYHAAIWDSRDMQMWGKGLPSRGCMGTAEVWISWASLDSRRVEAEYFKQSFDVYLKDYIPRWCRVGGRAWDEVWEQEDSSRGCYISLMRKMMMAQSKGVLGIEVERNEGLGFICRWNWQYLHILWEKGKKNVKDDSWVIWPTTWVMMLPFLGWGSLWRWEVLREAILVVHIPIVLE